ncbi:MAG: MoaD/ThiS family protein [Candidatus Ranarchaeia archaeon]
MKLIVKTMGPYVHKLKFKKMHVELPDGAKVRDLLELLSKKIPNFSSVVLKKDGSLYESQKFLINGYDVQVMDGPDTLLHDGDVIAVFPAVFGGI